MARGTGFSGFEGFPGFPAGPAGPQTPEWGASATLPAGVPAPTKSWAQPNPAPPPRALVHSTVDPAKPNGYPTWPGFDDCMCALKQMLEGALTVGDLAPHIHPPFDAIMLEPVSRAIITIPAAFDAAANAAGIALAAAEGAYQSIPILTPSELAFPFSAQTVFTFTTPQGFVAVFKKWGITVENSDATAASVTASVDSDNQGAAAPNPLVSGAASFEQQPTMLIVPENKTVKVDVQNLDTGSPILVTVSAHGWLLPVRRFEQTLRSMLKKPGFGTACQETCT